MRIENREGYLEGIREIEGRSVSADGLERNVLSHIVCEHSMDLAVNGRIVTKLVCTPSNLAELALGRLITEGIVSDGSEVECIRICEAGVRAEVYLSRESSLRLSAKPAAQEPKEKLPGLEKADWKAEWIFALAGAFAGGSGLHKATKGTHSCYLGVEGRTVFSCEDIGRHNAMDKCIGHAVLEGLEREKCILFTTGRVPTDMVKKAVAARIPVLVSKAVPTDAAVSMAGEYNLTLICKAWPDGFVIFNEGRESTC